MGKLVNARRAAIVFVGGGLGAGLRALLLSALASRGTVAPVLLANLLGAFALGVVFVLADEAKLLHAEARLFLAVGVLGGFTTFSTFGWGLDMLAVDHNAAGAAIYGLASVLGGVAAVWAGLRLTRVLTRTLTGRQPRRAHDPLVDMAAIEAEDRAE